LSCNGCDLLNDLPTYMPTVQYNTMQCSAMQCNAMQQHNTIQLTHVNSKKIKSMMEVWISSALFAQNWLFLFSGKLSLPV